MKNWFGLSSDTLFQLIVIYKSYRQVLTLVNNSQLLLKLEILDKLRLVTFHKWQHKESATLKLVHTSSGEMRVLMTLIHSVKMKTLVAKRMPFSMTQLSSDVLSLLCESVSLTQHNEFRTVVSKSGCH